MRSTILKLALAAFGAAAFATTASAQSVGVYVGPTPYYDYPGSYYYDGPTYGPRVYGYTRYYSAPAAEPAPAPGIVEPDRPSGPGGCGTYRFWNGERCIDARYK